jgi:hypothetical protein
MMWFDASERVACVPFTALYLLESAAHISECLFAGQPLPRPAALEDGQDDLYLGAWQFWRRVHEHRYRDDASLGVSFLAAVDFAVVSHGLVPSADSETQAELTSIPYRFGKLAYRAQGFEPLTLDGREPADAVARFQDGVCEWTGLPTQRQTLVTLSAFLTRRLLRSVGRHLGERELRNASRQLDRPLAEAGESLDEVWELIRTAASEGAPTIGQDSLGEMLNATAYRLSHPGVLAVAHAYERQLSAALPLPATLHQGKMLLDESAFGRVGWQGPYPREAVRLLTDAVGLTAIKPLLNHEPRCGFVADGLRCSYIGRGLGCPERGLTADERALRQRTGLDDFCHWMHRAVLLGLAPGEAQQRWEPCLREGDAQD